MADGKDKGGKANASDGEDNEKYAKEFKKVRGKVKALH